MKTSTRTAKDVAFIGLAAASLTAVKLALSWIANVELVTLFLVFYTFSLGAKRTFCACNIFILVEIFIYGFAPWTISYFIHWNALVLVVLLMKKAGVQKPIFYALLCLGITFLFGVQTSIVEVLFFSPNTAFFKAVLMRYFMGLTFFAVHMASSFFSVLIILPYLLKLPFLKK